MDPILLDLARAFAAGKDVRGPLGNRLEELGYGEVRDWHFGRPDLMMSGYWKPCEPGTRDPALLCHLPRIIEAGWEALDRDRLNCRRRLTAIEQAVKSKELLR